VNTILYYWYLWQARIYFVLSKLYSDRAIEYAHRGLPYARLLDEKKRTPK